MEGIGRTAETGISRLRQLDQGGIGCLEGKSRGDLGASRISAIGEAARRGSVAYADTRLDHIATGEVSVAHYRSVADDIEDVEDFKAQPQVHGLAD